MWCDKLEEIIRHNVEVTPENRANCYCIEVFEVLITHLRKSCDGNSHSINIGDVLVSSTTILFVFLF